MAKNPYIEIANVQWWTMFGAVLLSTGLILMFLSYSTQQIVPSVPYANVGSAFSSVSLQVLIIGFFGAAIGLIVMLYSKLMLSHIRLKDRYSDQ